MNNFTKDRFLRLIIENDNEKITLYEGVDDVHNYLVFETEGNKEIKISISSMISLAKYTIANYFKDDFDYVDYVTTKKIECEQFFNSTESKGTSE